MEFANFINASRLKRFYTRECGRIPNTQPPTMETIWEGKNKGNRESNETKEVPQG